VATACTGNRFSEAGFAEEALVVEVLVVESLTGGSLRRRRLRVRSLVGGHGRGSAVLGSACRLGLRVLGCGILWLFVSLRLCLRTTPAPKGSDRGIFLGRFLDLTAATGS